MNNNENWKKLQMPEDETNYQMGFQEIGNICYEYINDHKNDSFIEDFKSIAPVIT